MAERSAGGGPFAPLLMVNLIIDEGLTVEEISDKTGMTRKRVLRCLDYLKSFKRVYVDHWDVDATGKRFTCAAYKFTLVPKKDAPRPPPLTRKVIDARSYERKKGRVSSVFALAGRRLGGSKKRTQEARP